MSGWTRVFLIALRLAIGWHLLFEGVVKVRTHELGRTQSSTPFSSAAYLRDANGPLAKVFHSQAGDLDEEAQAKLGLHPLFSGEDGASIPEALEEDWEAYFQRWAAYYEVTGEQETKAREALAKAEENAGRWLQGREGEKEIPRSFGGLEVKAKQKPSVRIAEYRDKLRQLREMQDEALPAFERDVFKKELAAKKAEVARLRTDLMSDLNALVREPLQEVLTREQKSKPPLPDPSLAQPRDWLPESWPGSLSLTRGMLPPASGSPLVHWTDWLVRVGLVCIGLGLLLGLFTRLSCVMGVVLLALITVPYLPLPGLPENPRSLPFFYINQNIIEAIALLALATTASGRWVGLDGLLHVLRPSRYRSRSETMPSPNGPLGKRRVPETI
jgi:uncharacterized membrane protein YphA (DoxX/SURF4 family)